MLVFFLINNEQISNNFLYFIFLIFNSGFFFNILLISLQSLIFITINYFTIVNIMFKIVKFLISKII
jgi:hypothetical protein